jgi:hypothetical protein
MVVMQHPVTTEHQLAREHVIETLSPCATPVCRPCGSGRIPTPARTAPRAASALPRAGASGNIHFFKNMAPTDFLRLLYNSKCIVGNSSVGIRECSFLGVPAVNIGSRQAGRDRGSNVIDVRTIAAHRRGDRQAFLQRPISGRSALRQRQRRRAHRRRAGAGAAPDRQDAALLMTRFEVTYLAVEPFLSPLYRQLRRRLARIIAGRRRLEISISAAGSRTTR